MENLVANALKFAPAQSTITIEINYPQMPGGNSGSGAGGSSSA